MSIRHHVCPECGRDWMCEGCFTQEEYRPCDSCLDNKEGVVHFEGVDKASFDKLKVKFERACGLLKEAISLLNNELADDDSVNAIRDFIDRKEKWIAEASVIAQGEKE